MPPEVSPRTLTACSPLSATGHFVVEMSVLPNIEVLSSITDADASDIERLLGQLSTTAIFDRARLATMVTHDATDLLVVREGGRIVGAATLVPCLGRGSTRPTTEASAGLR